MDIGIKLGELDFNEFKFRLFKKFGKDTGGNAIFINSTISDLNDFARSEEFLNCREIYAYYCIYDQESIYKLSSLEEKEYFFNKDIKESESINLFDKDLSWVITLFNQNSI